MIFRVRAAKWNEIWRGIPDLRRLLRDWRKFLPIITLFLASLVLLLSGVMGYRYFVADGYHPYQDDRGRSGDAPEPLPEMAFCFDDASVFSIVSLRNLFNADRREWETEGAGTVAGKKVKEVSAMSPMIKDLVVYGVALVGSERKVLINDLEKGKKKDFRYVAEGDDVLGCRVKRIERERLILECREEEIVKTLQNRSLRDIGTGTEVSARDKILEKGKEIKRDETHGGDGSGIRSEKGRKGEEPRGRMPEKGKQEDGMRQIKELMDLMKTLEKK